MDKANPSRRRHNSSLSMQGLTSSVTWNQVLWRLYLFVGYLCVFPEPHSPLCEAYKETLLEQPIYVLGLAVILEILMYPLLVVVMVALLTPNHMKPKICDFSPVKFWEDHKAAHLAVYSAIYSTAFSAVSPLVNVVIAVYPLVYVTIATCTAVYGSNPLNWFIQSGMLLIFRKHLIRLNGINKLDFVYTWALVLIPLEGCWVSFMSAYHSFTEEWSISPFHKGCAVAVAIKLVLGILWTFYCVIQSRKIDPNTVGSANASENEKETYNDKVKSNIVSLVVFSVAVMPMLGG